MSAETKRREVLQMLAKGSISAQEASELLEQIEVEATRPEAADAPPEPDARSTPEEPQAQAGPGQKPRWLHVRVADVRTGRNKVSVKIPLSLARLGLRMGARYAPEVDELDWDEVLSQLNAAESQTLIEVQDEEDGEMVRIFVS